MRPFPKRCRRGQGALLAGRLSRQGAGSGVEGVGIASGVSSVG